jgi:hypothetical protein
MIVKYDVYSSIYCLLLFEVYTLRLNNNEIIKLRYFFTKIRILVYFEKEGVSSHQYIS